MSEMSRRSGFNWHACPNSGFATGIQVSPAIGAGSRVNTLPADMPLAGRRAPVTSLLRCSRHRMGAGKASLLVFSTRYDRGASGAGRAAGTHGDNVIRTLIAEKSSLIRAGMVALLSGADDIEVVAELQRGDQVVSTSRTVKADVAVLAAKLPGLDGFAAASALRAELPTCHALILSERRDPADLRRAVAAQAVGFLVRDASPDLITGAVRTVAAGSKVIDPDLAFVALMATEKPLTPRELEALRLARDGATTEEIAGELCLSVGTVRNYLSRAVMKTGGRNRVDAIRIASGAGWF